ncbi:MAG: hypothetical protein LBC59_04060 [Chitinispirillales bacterium]|jgi:hypothetical protein|nr:hypothetical protein [Chitinispirillales bacterium]
MSINELNSSVGSWSQFIKLKEAASKRNFGQSAKAASETAAKAGGTKFSEILSSKGGADVYLNPTAVKTFSDTLASVRAKDLPAKGKMFDSYA